MLKTGWLSPTGEFYEVDYMEHLSVAREIMSSFGLEVTNLADEDLKALGWVSIHLNAIPRHEWVIGCRNRLSEEQLRFIEPYLFDVIPISFSSQISLERFTDSDINY